MIRTCDSASEGFGDQHDDLIAALYQFVLASRVLRGLVDKARGAVEHSHSPDHVDVSGSHAEPSFAPRQRCNGASQRPFSEEVTCKSEAEQEKSDDCADRPSNGCTRKRTARKTGTPSTSNSIEHAPDFSELTQGRKIAIRLRCARLTDLIRIVQASRGHCRMKSIFKPLAHPGHCSAAQRVKHSANHDGERNDEGQHQERIGAAARQDAIVDLKQIDGGSEKKEIVTAAICEQSPIDPAQARKAASNGVRGGDIMCDKSGGITIAVPRQTFEVEPFRPRHPSTSDELRTGGPDRRSLLCARQSNMHDMVDREVFGTDGGRDVNISTLGIVVVSAYFSMWAPTLWLWLAASQLS